MPDGQHPSREKCLAPRCPLCREGDETMAHLLSAWVYFCDCYTKSHDTTVGRLAAAL